MILAPWMECSSYVRFQCVPHGAMNFGDCPVPMSAHLGCVVKTGKAAFHPSRRGPPWTARASPEGEKRTLSAANPARRRKMGHSEFDPAIRERRPWNAARMVGAKRALKPQQVWAIRFWLDRERRPRDRAVFDLAIDSKLRGCDVVKIRIGELVSGGRVRTRATVTQRKTGRPVQFELLETARSSLQV